MSADSLPRPFGPYALLALVGRGGMGDVYLAKTGGLQGYEKLCVVKTLRAEVADNDEYARRFSEEARVVVQLAHRNICHVFDVGRADGSLYMAMEHVIGTDLRQLAKADRVPLALGLYVVSEVLEALDYAHRFVDATTGEALSLVHRDVSPQNILLGAEGDVKLIDFGVATSTRLGPVTESGTVLGKLNYMAPEHARGEEVDGRADQWSAAVVLVELLTRNSFYAGLERQAAWAVSGQGTHRPAGFADIEPSLRAILDRALAPLRDDRFPSCSAFAEALVGWARAHGEVADCRDLRRVLTKQFGDLAASARARYRAFADVAPPTLEPSTPGASPWESIATTMMVVPPTTGLDVPGTMIVRERRPKAPLATAPKGPAPSRGRALVAFGAGAALAALATWGLVGAQRSAHHDGAGADAGVLVTERAPAALTPPPVPAPTPPALDAGVVPSSVAAATPDPLTSTDPVATSSTGSPSDRPRRLPNPSKPRFKPDKGTKATLDYLAAECRQKVPCAQTILDWSKRLQLEAERAELADAAADCAKKCKLK